MLNRLRNQSYKYKNAEIKYFKNTRTHTHTHTHTHTPKNNEQKEMMKKRLLIKNTCDDC